MFVKCLGFGLNLKANGLEARLKMGLREMKGKYVKKLVKRVKYYDKRIELFCLKTKVEQWLPVEGW